MKHLPNIVGALLGLAFIAFGLVYFLKMMPPQPPPPPDSAAAKFMGAFAPTGYLDFVKALEILGGLLVAIPRTRNFGLLVLGPILINVLAFHVFITKGAGLYDPPLIVLSVMAAYLLWSGRKAFAELLR
jgi:putative oxidoreductase